MLHILLANFYERDIRKLTDEVNLFKNEEDLWKIRGSVKNSGGNLVLHIIGNLNFYIGTTLAHTGYVRNRDQEFSKKGVPRKELVAQLEGLIPIIKNALSNFTGDRMEAEFPLPHDNAKKSNADILIHLLAHLNYHLGQVNYLRRMLE